MHLVLDESHRHIDDLMACYQSFVGHELLNQLVATQAYARLLLEEEGDRLSDEGKQMLTRLADLTQKTDDLARRVAEIGRMLREPAEGSPVGVMSILHEVAAECKALSGRDEVQYAITGNDFRAPVSSRLLHRVVWELTDNAVRAVPPRTEGLILLSAASGRITVQDNGSGLTEADRSILMEPFAAGRRPGAERFGLGFFLVRQTIARWKGRIEIQSNQGTTVTLTIPVEA